MAKKNHRRRKPVRSKPLPDLLAVAIDALALLIKDVATDPRKLKPGQLCSLLNSTPLGTVITTLRLKKHRDRAGLRIGDGKTVDLLRYAAWLIQQRRRGSSGGSSGPNVSQETSLDSSTLHDAYARKRERSAARERSQSEHARDIAPLPSVVNPDRKARAAKSFRVFCEEYFGHNRFRIQWSDDHLRVIAKMETAVLHGGLFALAMPRASGKTTLVECLALWAILYGYRRYVVVIGATATDADKLLTSMKRELETNDYLAEDFPEACHPIKCLEGRGSRCKGQLHCGARTDIEWQAKRLVLATIPGAQCSAAIIEVRGITGTIRGMKFVRPDGDNVRPDFVIPDDPQTKRSARSPGQCEFRESVLVGDCLGLAGPDVKISGVMPCTVICKGDTADRMLDRKLHPEWSGEKMQLVYEWPPGDESKRLLDQYAEMRSEEIISDPSHPKATAFWKKHHKKIEAGARVAWPHRHYSNQYSGVQYAYDLLLDRGPAEFAAEYQNNPVDATQDTTLLTVEEIQAKVNGYKRGEVPVDVTHLTCMIDVQGELLYWIVCGWADNFSGWVLDYGAWPDQQQRYFTLASARHTLSLKYPRLGPEARWRKGLDDLEAWLMTRKWKRDDGVEMQIEKGLKDANYGDSTDTVYNQIRESPYNGIWHPSHGRGITAGQKPMREWAKKQGEQRGLNWMLRPTTSRVRAIRHVLFDSNWWKSFVHARLAVALGDSGCLSFWKPSAKTEHRMIAEHLRAEKRDRKTSETTQQTVDEWTEKPGKPDNHGLDLLVGAAVAASMCGCAIGAVAIPKPKKVSFAELQRQARERRLGGVA